MPSLLSLLSGPMKGLVDSLGGVIDKFVTTDKEKAAAQLALVTATKEFELKMAEVDKEWAAMQRDVIVAEANGHSWLQRNWRPITMLSMVFLIGYIIFTGGYVNGRELEPSFVTEILEIIKIGLGGYVIGRSLEKIAPSVASIVKKK